MDIETILKNKAKEREQILAHEYNLDRKIAKTASMIRDKTLTVRKIKFERIPERILEMDNGLQSFTPTTVYNEYRLEDWMPMPTEEQINNNEVYILFHVPIEATAEIYFTVKTQNGSNYIVDYGKMKNGVYEVIDSSSVVSENVYNKIFTDINPDTTTANGMNQIMIRIHPEGETDNITELNFNSSLPSQNIVEISAKLPEITTLNFNRNLKKLKFFNLYGTNKITDFYRMFEGLKSLLCIKALDIRNVNDLSYMFNECNSLMAIPELNLENVIDAYHMFANCYSLIKIFIKNVEKIRNTDYMFFNCESLLEIENLNFNSVNSCNSMFRNCCSLRKITNVHFKSIDAYMFYDCQNLIKFDNCSFDTIISLNTTFRDCYSLIEIPILPTIEKQISLDFAFSYCFNLKEITLDCNHQEISLYYTFACDNSLQKVTLLNGENIIGINVAFLYCKSLMIIKGLNTRNCTNLSSTFGYCNSLSILENIDISKVDKKPSNCFKECCCLGKFTCVSGQTLPTTGNNLVMDYDFSYCSFNHEAIVELINSLPNKPSTNNNTYKLIVTNNRGVKKLTDEEKAVATNKGWTLVC